MSKKVENMEVEARMLLRQKGLRATTQRLAVLAVLRDHKKPISHEQVMGCLAKGQFDKATVWRVLSDLVGVEIVHRMDLGDRVWRYELLDVGQTLGHDHAHFLCNACGEVTCLPPLELRAKDGTLPTALIHADTRLQISGNCGDCVE